MQVSSLARLASLIGQTGQLNTREGLSFEVEIIDVKQAWGKTRYVVRSTTGDDTLATVDDYRVTVSEVAA